MATIIGCGSGRGARGRVPSPSRSSAGPVAQGGNNRSSVPLSPKKAKPARPAKQPSIRLKEESAGAQAVFEVINLKQVDLDRLASSKFSKDQWKELFAVYVDEESQGKQPSRPAVIGSYQVENKALRFVPRFPLERGLCYRAVFNFAKLPNHQDSEHPLVAQLRLPKARPLADTIVLQVYPTSNKLPENQLKFYIHFSAAMSRGGSYQHIHLLDSAGKAVDLPFLELDEELWDPDGKRFTLFFDPGRIKRGLKPREEVGPALEEGKSYTLMIDSNWQDATGSPLKASFRKIFTVGAPDDKPPDPATWKFEPPAAGSEKALVIVFPKPMDHALLQRTIGVTNSNGQKIAGIITVENEEKTWQFTPQRAWQAGKFWLAVDKVLEDLAGNSIGKPFEVDVLHPIQQQVQAEVVKLPFQVSASDSSTLQK